MQDLNTNTPGVDMQAKIERLQTALREIQRINSTEMLATMHGTASSKTSVIATLALDECRAG